MKRIQLIYGMMAGLIFLGMKLIFKLSDVADLDILLYPTNLLFSTIENTNWQYKPGSGYYYPDLGIIVNKACSGANFLLICFLTFIFTTISIVNSYLKAIGMFMISILISYALTVTTNVSRIIILLKIGNLGIGVQGWRHEAIGSFVYLTMLFLTFVMIKYTIKRISVLNKPISI